MINLKYSQLTRLLLSLLTSVFILAACSSSQETPEDAVSISRREMDQGRVDNAILILSQALAQNPQDDKARVNLAAAHMLKAGLKLEKFYGLIETFFAPPQPVSDSPLARLAVRFRVHGIKTGAEKNTQTTISDFLTGLDRLFLTSEDILFRIDKIPDFTEDSLPEVKLALNILDGLVTVKRGPALYRAIVRTVYLKHELNNNDLINWNVPLCSLPTQSLQKIFDTLYFNLQTIAIDTASGVPSTQNQLAATQKTMQDAYLSITRFLDVAHSFSGKDPLLSTLIKLKSKSDESGKFQCDF